MGEKKKKQKILSIEIGFATIRICEMEQGERPKIHRLIEVPTPELAISDGYIHSGKQEAVKTAILEALKKYKVRTKKVVFTVFSSKIITREVLLPAMKEKQLKQVIEENINDYFPIELENYYVTHTIIDAVMSPENTLQNKLLVIAAEKGLISQYERLADKCHFTLLDIDYVGNSVYQVLKKVPRFEPQMYVKVEPDNTLLMILEEDRLVLQRSLNYGTGLGEMDENEMRDAIRPIMGTISRILHFYSGQSYKHIGKVTLIGRGAEHVDLFNEVGRGGVLEYDTLQSSDGIRVQRQAKKDNSVSDFIAGIGAGIDPVKLFHNKSGLTTVNYFRASFLMVILYAVIIASLWLMAYIPYLDAQQKKLSLEREGSSYQEAREIYEHYVSLKTFYENFQAGEELTKHANDGLLAFIEELEKKMPQDVEISSLSSDDTTVVMQMKVANKEVAAGTIDTLRGFDSIMSLEVTSFAGGDLDTIENDQKENDVSFTITCQYYPVGAVLEEKPTDGTATTQEDIFNLN